MERIGNRFWQQNESFFEHYFVYLVYNSLLLMLPHLYPRRRVPTLLLAAGCVLAVGFPERTAAQGDTFLVYVSVMQEEKREGEQDTRL